MPRQLQSHVLGPKSLIFNRRWAKKFGVWGGAPGNGRQLFQIIFSFLQGNVFFSYCALQANGKNKGKRSQIFHKIWCISNSNPLRPRKAPASLPTKLRTTRPPTSGAGALNFKERARTTATVFILFFIFLFFLFFFCKFFKTIFQNFIRTFPDFY